MRARAAVAAALGAVVAMGCGGGSVPQPVTPELALCLALAELRAEDRANAECPLDKSFAECPAHDEIMAEFRASQEKCK